jgi:hypothetical protein
VRELVHVLKEGKLALAPVGRDEELVVALVLHITPPGLECHVLWGER